MKQVVYQKINTLANCRSLNSSTERLSFETIFEQKKSILSDTFLRPPILRRGGGKVRRGSILNRCQPLSRRLYNHEIFDKNEAGEEEERKKIEAKTDQ